MVFDAVVILVIRDIKPDAWGVGSIEPQLTTILPTLTKQHQCLLLSLSFSFAIPLFFFFF